MSEPRAFQGLLLSGVLNEEPETWWVCEPFGLGEEFTIRKKETPNLFNRFMQRLCFGNVWRKVRINSWGNEVKGIGTKTK